MNIMLVDDDESVRAVLARSLRRMGHAVLTADSFSSGWETARSQQRQLDGVISDLDLGDGSGDELIRRMKEDALAASFVLFTGRLDYCLPLDLTSVALMYKPCTAAELLNALRTGGHGGHGDGLAILRFST